MQLKFHKYQGTGNDFIMIWAGENPGFVPNAESICKLCDRRYGIGADGFIIIKSRAGFDFEVDYYNADGSQSFCGNGARCSVVFAAYLGLIKNTCRFWAIDGEHEAEILVNSSVKLKMSDVHAVKNLKESSHYEIYTGSPHYVFFTDKPKAVDIVEFGKNIRYSETYKAEGINVNTAYFDGNCFQVQTYERGVENETFSCGTGVTAVAIAGAQHFGLKSGKANIQTKGGALFVHWKKTGNLFHNIYLEGPATRVYEGSITI